MPVSFPGSGCKPCGVSISTICPVKLTGVCVFYGGAPINGINTGDTLDVIVNKLTSSASTGTVTSVALGTPNIFTVAGSPITTSGTLTISLNTQTANQVFAGPTTGAAATPSFRALVAADIPTPTNGLSIVGTGTGLGGTLTNAVTQVLTGGNVFRFRDQTADPGHNLQHLWQGAAYILAGDSTNNFPSKIELQDSISSTIALRIVNSTNTSGTNLLSIQMINGVTVNPSINFMNNGNVIIANSLLPTDDGAPIQIKGATSHASPVGIGTGSTITAKLHIAAGSVTAGSAPIKLTSGPVLTTPENGTFEFDGTHLYFTIGSTRNTLI